MAATWMEEGLDQALHVVTLGLTRINWVMHLNDNDITPDCTDTASDYNDCTLSGYAPIDFHSSFTGFATAACIARCNAGVLTFTFDPYSGTPVVIYGYYCLDSLTGKLMFAEVLTDSGGSPAPYTVPFTGGSVVVLPFFSLRKL